MKRELFIIATILCFLCACSIKPSDVAEINKQEKLTSHVNTFIGTGGHGHTYPGASMPFGMMQLGPDTRLTGWDGCGGYHYSDHYVYGFSHTHLSGTGVSDYGDVLLMPTTEINFHNGADGLPGYRTRFSHENESAEPGYYQVWLDSTDIKVELTVAARSGIHKYSYPTSDNQFLILDLVHRDELLDHKIERVSATEIRGYRHSKAWAEQQQLYYYMIFSEPMATDSWTIEDGEKRLGLRFDNPDNKPVYVKVGISAVDMAGAHNNLKLEIANKTFDQVRYEAQQTWQSQLEKIVVETDDYDDKVNFYTAMYHAMLAPNIYNDIDGRYRGMDLEVHDTKYFDYYTVFSLWDTYRAAHPLFTIIEQDRTNDFINTFIAKYDEGGIMPIWDLAANYTHCMIGYHAVPVIADAYLKGIDGYNVNAAFSAMKHSATRTKLGLESYKQFGFIPVEEEAESVSKTLEYAYDDWTIAMMAQKLGRRADYEAYLRRAQCYKNIYDPETKFMRGRFRNTWFSPFDPYEVNFNYTEANSWQYSFYVPQDVTGFIALMGGKSELEAQMDKLFTANDNTSGRHQVDITGLIGQYAHGNEPSHHIAYLYNFVNKPHKTQERVHQILKTLYRNDPDGISGNEDCGQMSAWYVLSSMGFYSVTPGSNEYIIGTPLFDQVSINLENKNQFTIKAKDRTDTNIYIQSAELNGQPYPYSYLRHEDLMAGGTLIFHMGGEPSTWATSDSHIPITSITEQLITPTPYVAEGEIAFLENTVVVLSCVDPEALIMYQINGSPALPYEQPITISQATELTIYAEKNGVRSGTVTTSFFKLDPNLTIELGTDYANQYNAGGVNALIDGVMGTKDFRTGTWQGYYNEDVVATLDLGSPKAFEKVQVNFLDDQRSWIFLPKEVELFVSHDGEDFIKLSSSRYPVEESDQAKINSVIFNIDSKDYRYVRIVAKRLGDLPKWHLGHAHGGKAWIFVDEISIK